MERKYRRGEDRVTRGKRDEATGSQGAEEEIEEKLFSQSSCFGALRWLGSKSKKNKKTKKQNTEVNREPKGSSLKRGNQDFCTTGSSLDDL